MQEREDFLDSPVARRAREGTLLLMIETDTFPRVLHALVELCHQFAERDEEHSHRWKSVCRRLAEAEHLAEHVKVIT